jgi:regulator of replication initiation timing
MALSLTALLQSVDDKVTQLSAVQTQLKARIAALEEENDNLRYELDNTRKELAAARTDAEFLTMSHRLADSPDTIISARRRIARLIRTIDNCISMLKEE